MHAKPQIGIIGRGAIGLGLSVLLDNVAQTIHLGRIELASYHHWAKLDLLVIPVKHYQLPELVDNLKRAGLPNSLPLLLLQNGFGGHDLVTAKLDNPLYIGTTTDAIVKNADASITINARGELRVGSSEANRQACFALRTLLKAHPRGVWDEHIIHSLYKKLAVNAVINPLTAKYACKNGTLLHHRQELNALVAEIYQVYEALGLDFDMDSLAEHIEDVIALTSQNYSSMHQDIFHGRQTEVDGILGVLISKGKALGVNTPIMRSLYDDLKALEAR